MLIVISWKAKMKYLQKINKKINNNYVINKKIVIRKIFYLSLFFCISILNYISSYKSSFASVIYPQRYGAEGRFKSWLYHKNGIYYYEGHYMNPTYIEFSSGEKVNTIYIPKPDAWSIKTTNNRLFLTPITEDAETTMTVMTDQRTYFFELHAKMPDGPFDPELTFFVKFRYPSGSENQNTQSSSDNDGSIIQYAVSKGPDLSKSEKFNFNYTVSGDYKITPIKVFDDGQFTYFEFREKNGIIPAIFSVDSDGFESIVNFRIINQYLAVESVESVFTLRHGAETVCVFNETMRGLARNLTQKIK